MARTRFAISPIFELTHSLQALRDPSRAAIHLPWLRSISGRLDGLDLRPVIALIPPRGYTPDFLTPPPDGPLGDIEDELVRVRATPTRTILDEMAVFRRANRAPRVAEPWLEAPRRQLKRTADTLEAFWERAL